MLETIALNFKQPVYINCKLAINAAGEIKIFVNNDKQAIEKLEYIRICPNVAIDTSFICHDFYENF
jgi:hypothetical protein